MTTATANDGTLLEREIEHLLRLTPGSEVKRHERIAGKGIDLLLVQRSPVLGEQRVAVECKDYARPLRREQVAAIWRDYEPLTGVVDAVLIATRNGLVPNAKDLVDSQPKLRHATERELLDGILDVGRLVQGARATFDDKRLRDYYQPTECYPVDLDLALEHHELYFGPLADWCRERLASRADWAIESPDGKREIVANLVGEWEDEHDSTDEIPYPDLQILTRILECRTRSDRISLEEVALDWLERDGTDGPVGLAVLGSYGTGKSSFARALAARQADRSLGGESNRVPILIELGTFSVHQSIAGLITHELANRHQIGNASFDTFKSLNERGRFLVILDGFDEMKEGMSADALAFNFSELNGLLRGSAKVVLCGRPTVFASEDERREALRRSAHGEYAPSRYVEVRIAPMPVERVRVAIRSYASARRDELGVLDDELDELDRELEQDEHLRELLARPVHYPMLLRGLPRWRGRLAEVTRTNLYEAFIAQTAARESKPGRPGAISDHKRRRFAGDLAIAMLATGDARAIRHDQVPDHIVEPYRRGDEALSTTRRDLIRSCFLETKPPDILFFPHRSFAEYLAASRFAEVLTKAAPDTDTLGVKPTPEIASFLSELLRKPHWRRALAELPRNGSLARFFLDRLPEDYSEYPGDPGASCDVGELRRAVADAGVLAPLLERGTLLAGDKMVRMSLASALKRLAECGYPLAPESSGVLATLVGRDVELVAVDAYRALAKLDPTEAAATAERHPDRLDRWRQKGWI